VSELEAVEREWAAIVERCDVEAARQLLDDDFSLSSIGGVAPHVPRDAWLATLPRIDTRSLSCEVIDERIYGGVAVVQARLAWNASVDGRDLSGDYAVTDVFRCVEARWRPSWRVSVRLASPDA
jgi:hypothetical protein